MLVQGYFPAAVITLVLSLVASLLLDASSRSFGAIVVYAMPAKIEPAISPTSTSAVVATSSTLTDGGNDSSSRNLFELVSPFETVNDQCARVCGEEEGNDDESLINACPKVSKQNK